MSNATDHAKLGMLVLMACLLIPASAQAFTIHGLSWTQNGQQNRVGEKKQAIAWGTLTIQTPNQTVTCRGAEAAKAVLHSLALMAGIHS